ncbi:hypothetical protein [Pseudomonas sp.]|uniref:hypothetical protein n=1 Tax=Pseudomonas sp. TaxID=306 RepID=UPI00258D76AA|nr:hypothetical protein [Pseudomonas sp.]
MSIEFVPETPVMIDTETPATATATKGIPEALAENPDVSPESSSANPDALIHVVKSGSCPSLTSRSTLGYELGLKDESELYLRLVSNTGSGFFSKEWVPCSVIEQLINGSAELTSTSFKAIFPNKSVNTGGFVMAVIKHLGLLQVNGQNSRWHEHVKESSFAQVLIEARMPEEEAEKLVVSKATGKRKHKEA